MSRHAAPLTRRSIARLYLVLQGCAILAWWLLLLLAPASRRYFLAPALPDLALLSFWLADLTLAISSIYVGLVRRHGRELGWVGGGMLYATLYCVGQAVSTGHAWAAPLCMIPAAVGTALAARTLAPTVPT